MFSKQELEGYLEIDNRQSPGITPEEALLAGRGTMPVGGGMRFQSATYNCCGCQTLIVKNPLRQRERTYCAKCDKYMCDMCAAELQRTGVHKSIKQKIDEFLDAMAKAT